MAGTPVSSARQTIFEEDVKYKRSWSEALGFKIGAAINFINDRLVYSERVDFGGYFRPTAIDQYEHSIYLYKPTVITAYVMSIAVTANGTHELNFSVVNNLGAVVGNLFTTAPNIEGAGKTDSAVGRNIQDSSTLERNVPATFDNGVLDAAYDGVEIPAGYSLRPYVATSSAAAIGASLTLFLEVQE